MAVHEVLTIMEIEPRGPPFVIARCISTEFSLVYYIPPHYSMCADLLTGCCPVERGLIYTYDFNVFIQEDPKILPHILKSA